MKHKITALLTVTITITALVFIAAFITADKTKYHNDFVRIFPPHAADETKMMELTKKASLVGVSTQSFYLASGKNVSEISFDRFDTRSLPIENPNTYEVAIDSLYFTLQSGSSGRLQLGNSAIWKVDTTYFEATGFTAVKQISKKTAVLRVIDMAMRKNLLVKTSYPRLKKDILKKQVDGILCTDGFLLYNTRKYLLLYLYRYRNEVICMDTSLNIVRTFRTIDTTSVAKIEVTETNDKITMSKPPLVVNKSGCMDGDNLFVQSNLVARNEDINESKSKSVIDVYNINDGSYRFSFYIPDRGKDKLESFRVKDTTLITKFPHHVARHRLLERYLTRKGDP